MKNLITTMLVFASLAISGVATAQPEKTLRYEWTHPTTLTDGTALPLSAIVRTEIWCETAGQIASVDAPATQHDEVYTADFNDNCWALTIGPLYDDGTGEQSSAPSGVIAVQVVIPKVIAPPSAPTGFGAQLL